MKVYELEQFSVFSDDGGITWYTVLSIPKYVSKDQYSNEIEFFATPVNSPTLKDSKSFQMHENAFIWAPNADDVNSGAEIFRVASE